MLAFGGVIGGFTYIAFTLTEVGGSATGTVPWLRVLSGAGTVAGNHVGGRFADRHWTRRWSPSWRCSPWCSC